MQRLLFNNTLLLIVLVGALLVALLREGLLTHNHYTPEALHDALSEQLDDGQINQLVSQQLADNELEEAHSYLLLAGQLGIDSDPKLQAELVDRQNHLPTQIRAFGQGFVDGEIRDGSSLAGAITADLSVYGDLRDFYRQTELYLRGEEVDRFLYTLSIVGIAATASTLLSAGLSTPAKVGLSTLKAAHKQRLLSPRFIRSSQRLFDEALDLKRFKRELQQIDPRDLPKLQAAIQRLINSARPERLAPYLKNLQKLRHNSSTLQSLLLLKYCDSPQELTRLVRINENFTQGSRAVLKTLGRGVFKLGRFSRIATRLLWASWGLLLQATALLGLRLLRGSIRR